MGDLRRFSARIGVKNGQRRTLLDQLAYLGEIVSIGEKKNCVGRATERRVGQPLGVFYNEARGLSYGFAKKWFVSAFYDR